MSKFAANLFNHVVLFIISSSATQVDNFSLKTTRDEQKAISDTSTDLKHSSYAVLVIGLGTIGWSVEGLCSGTLLSPKWVLTASNCMRPNGNLISRFVVYAGGKSFNEMTNESASLPEGSQARGSFKIFELSNGDLTLIEVRSEFRITEYVKPMKLGTEPWMKGKVRDCKVTGFGGELRVEGNQKLYSNRKTHVLQTETPCKCHESFPKEVRSQNSEFFSCSLPKSDHGLCTGDSGAGLICDNQLQGVATMIGKVEYNNDCNILPDTVKDKKPCGSNNSVTLFTLVCPHLLQIEGFAKILRASEISKECRVLGRNGAKMMTVKSGVMPLIILIFMLP